MTIKFHWGHDHDFGDFKMEGMMGDRHIRLLSNFASLFPINLAEFEDKDVFDVGGRNGSSAVDRSYGARETVIAEGVAR